MFVYGIRCPVTFLPRLPEGIKADYYMEYGLLVFPNYTQPTGLRSHLKQMTPEYIELCRRVIECQPTDAIEMDRLEHPYLTSEEADAVWAVKTEMPEVDSCWFHVKTLALPPSPSSL